VVLQAPPSPPSPPPAPAAPGAPPTPAAPARPGALARLASRPSGRAGLWLIVPLVAFALVGPWLAGHDPNVSDFALGQRLEGLPAGPGPQHWLGTDSLYRDEFARLAHGARLSLLVATLATALSASLGTLVGVGSGWAASGRAAWVDAVLMRLVDALLALPYLLVVLALGAALDRSDAGTLLAVLGLTGWLGTARVLRAKTIEVCARPHVEAARALGLKPLEVLTRHVLPHVAGPLVVFSSTSMASMLLAESMLSYLRVGVPPPAPSLGRMLVEGQPLLGLSPRLVLAPALPIVVGIFGFHLLGEGLRDALAPEEGP
jgi:ABC-type dipeptide/oligopeptide/nickel transport system permease subunit